MFKPLGMLLGLYVAYALYVGEVVTKKGYRRKVVRRDDTPGEFWIVIVIYSGLAAFMLLYR
jgi:hypothetical protein